MKKFSMPSMQHTGGMRKDSALVDHPPIHCRESFTQSIGIDSNAHINATLLRLSHTAKSRYQKEPAVICELYSLSCKRLYE